MQCVCVSSDVLKRFIKNKVILFLSLKTSLIHRFLLSFQLGSVPQNVYLLVIFCEEVSLANSAQHQSYVISAMFSDVQIFLEE